MNPDVTESNILEAMERYGGSFVRGLAHLFRLADPHNQAILRNAFGHYFREYEAMARIGGKG